MFGLHFASHVGPIGIDFSAHGVRMLQLRRRRGRLQVAGAALIDRARADERPEAAAQRLTADVHEALASGGFLGRKCVVALPRQDMLLQSVRLPQLAGAELKQAARWEAAERLHLDSDAIEVDYVRMGEIQRPNEVRDEVLLIATLRARLHERLNPLIAAGLRPVAVDAPFLALARCHSMRCRREADRDHVRGLLEVGATGSTFMVLRGDQIAMCKTLAFGGRDFDAAVAAHLGIEPEVAADLRAKRLQHQPSAAAPGGEATVRPGAAGEDWSSRPSGTDSADRAVFEAVRPLIDQLIKEVGLCLRYYNVTFRGKPAEQVVLAGSEALEPHLDEMLSRGCKLPVVIDDPVTPVGDLFDEIVKSISHCTAPPQSWTVPAGLSMRGLFLKPSREQDARAPRKVAA